MKKALPKPRQQPELRRFAGELHSNSRSFETLSVERVWSRQKASLIAKGTGNEILTVLRTLVGTPVHE